ncbi:hypothetical protein SAPIO_CDS2545 [Scedosporium apiospermum]|uniref:Uncharacterized protein n=1 Tax=Pseudallescheria apiosperma TaxID=563466 RepID=A0A084GCQ0_PSEDA|nr:uncharacterized protein SAPIO_CDS2545 [Scedosporium apiospermum]KEZ45112.1 hypothetical protein SAPIO_CDS2545 [Scedosporium apiospermum]
MTANSKMMSARIQIASADELETSIEQSIYWTLIPVTWKISPPDLNTLTSGSRAAESSFVCDKKNDRGYYLVPSEDPKNNSFSRSGRIDAIGCREFEMLPGTDELGCVWGGITKEDIVMGSLATYKANGNKNVGGSEPWSLKESKAD